MSALKTATQQYSGAARAKKVQKQRKLVRKKGRALPETPEGQLKAVKLLQSKGFLPQPQRCCKCGWSLGSCCVYREKHVIMRCNNNDCRRQFNILGQAPWLSDISKMSLSPMQMHALLLSYTSSALDKPVGALAVARSIGSTEKPVKAVLEACRRVESPEGERLNRAKMSGALELDATSIRKIRIGLKTEKYKDLVNAWVAKNPRRRKPKHFLLFMRIIGCCKRGSSQLVLRQCPHRLVPAGAKPPVESTQEVLESKILDCVNTRSSCYTTAFTDGANAYKSAASKAMKSKTLKWHQVKHTQSQFTKPIRKRSAVKKAGTQQIDRIWFHVKKAVPKSLNNRGSDGFLNEDRIMEYVYAWLFRRRCSKDIFETLGKLCAKDFGCQLWGR